MKFTLKRPKQRKELAPDRKLNLAAFNNSFPAIWSCIFRQSGKGNRAELILLNSLSRSVNIPFHKFPLHCLKEDANE